ncbi:MAG TPA: zinc-ribbon domain-containing protein [Dongiaceae bacterium]|jgi:predicted Zn finger-like uncharacterized protein|nr:zinc-ribbon domain-containing protein [Dongiaceae bacterium]
MLIVCPSCTTSFAVPDHLIGPMGRTVQCTRCAHRWKAMRVAQEPPAEPTQPMVETPYPSIPDIERRVRPIGPGELREYRFPWIRLLILVLLFAIAGAGYYYWAQIDPLVEDLWNRSGIAGYLHLGSAEKQPSAQRLQIANVHFNRLDHAHGDILIEAQLFNPTETALPPPPMIAVALDKHGKELPPYRSILLEKTTVAPGETLTFQTMLHHTPDAVETLRLGFAAN